MRDLRAKSTTPGRIPAPTVLLLLILTGLVAVLPLRTPEPSADSAPAGDFSAARAGERLDSIAAVPHPTGSAAQQEVREYLVGELRELGLRPRIQELVAAREVAGGTAVAGSVANVHATITGTEPTGRILLVAHYDSVPIGPGAADNGSNVASILEIVRVLESGPRLRNDVEILFTDGEEPGLIGARAFVDAEESADAAAAPPTVVVNLESRGSSGPVVMFQTAGTGLTPAVRASGVFTTSVADEVFGRLPYETDLTVFGEAGMRGLNFAFMGDSANYHTEHDDLARLDRSSMQDMGEAALGAVRHLGGADLTQDGPEATYFSLLGTVVSYPVWAVLPLAVAALLGVPLLIWFGRGRGVSAAGAGRAAATLPLPLIGAAVVGLAGWWLLASVRPEFALNAGHVHNPGRYAVGALLLLLVPLLVWYRWTQRRASPLDTAVAVLGWFALFAVLCAVLLPGGAYLFTWPTLVGLVSVAAALRFTPEDSPWRTVAGAGVAAPASALVLPIVFLMFDLGLAVIVVPLVLAALFGTALAGVLGSLARPRALTTATLAVTLAGTAVLGAGTALDGYSADQPRPVSLGYVLEADTDEATWVSLGGRSDPVVGQLLTGEPARYDDRVPPLGGVALANGTADAAPLDLPRVAEESVDEADGVRTVRLRLHAPAEAHTVAVYAGTGTHRILDATVGGAEIAGGSAPTADEWGWSFRYAAPPVDGLDLVIRARGEGPLRLRVVSTTTGLPDGVGTPALAVDQAWASWPSVAGQTFVARTFRI